MSLPNTYLQMLSTVTEDAELRLELVEQEMPTPKSDQVIIKVEATPINPSDHGVMFGWTDMSKATSTGSGKDIVQGQLLRQVIATTRKAFSGRESRRWAAAWMARTAPRTR